MKSHYGMSKPSRPKSSAKLVMGEASGKQKPKRSSKMKY